MLDRKKSEELFYRFKTLGDEITLLRGVVQNPDFINEDNASETLKVFLEEHYRLSYELEGISYDVAELFKPLLPNNKI